MSYLILIAVLLLAFISGVAASGFVHPAIDFLSNFQWHFVMAALFLGPIALLYGARRTAVVAVCVAVFAFYQTQKYEAVQPDLTQLRGSEKLYTLVTFNSWGHTANATQLVGFLRQTQPDFVFLQEVYADKYTEIQGLRDIYPYMQYCPHHLCTMLFLSKYPWQSISSGRDSEIVPAKIDVAFGPELDHLRLVQIHASRPHHYYDTQRIQLDGLGPELANISTPVVVGGDFNATAFSAPMRDFLKSSGLKVAGGYLTTWPQRTRHFPEMVLPFAQFGLDQFLVNGQVQLIHVERGPELGSDHMPVILSFTVP